MQSGGSPLEDVPTLAPGKRLATVYTPISEGIDFRPILPDPKGKRGNVTKKNCPDGVGCSMQATDNAAAMLGVNRQELIPGDAQYRNKLFENYGMTRVWNPYFDKGQKVGDDKTYVPFDRSMQDSLKMGDLVGLDRGSTSFFGYGPPPGLTSKDGDNVEHFGTVIGFTKEGNAIIRHGRERGKDKGEYIDEILQDNGKIKGWGTPYRVATVYRHPGVGNSDIMKRRHIVQTRQETAAGKLATETNATWSLKDSVPSYSQLERDRAEVMKELVDLFNDKNKDNELKYRLGITQQELDRLKPVVFGLAGQESGFGNPGNEGREIKEFLDRTLRGKHASRGTFQIRYTAMTDNERAAAGITKPKDLDSTAKAYAAAVLMLNNSRKEMNRQIAMGTHPDLADKDEYWRAGYAYNSPARAKNTAEDWARIRPRERKRKLRINAPYDPKELERERKEDAAYFNLRMDEGSYPRKLMEKAQPLQVNYDFEKAAELEPVTVIGVKSKNAKVEVPELRRGGPIVSSRGQWDYPGQDTIIPGNNITMQGVSYPVMAYPSKGRPKLMMPGRKYRFPNASYVYEKPLIGRI